MGLEAIQPWPVPGDGPPLDSAPTEDASAVCEGTPGARCCCCCCCCSFPYASVVLLAPLDSSISWREATVCSGVRGVIWPAAALWRGPLILSGSGTSTEVFHGLLPPSCRRRWPLDADNVGLGGCSLARGSSGSGRCIRKPLSSGRLIKSCSCFDGGRACRCLHRGLEGCRRVNGLVRDLVLNRRQTAELERRSVPRTAQISPKSIPSRTRAEGALSLERAVGAPSPSLCHSR